MRVMVDRLVHLHALAKRGDWRLFDDWSFVWQYEADQRALSDPYISNKAAAAQPKRTKEQLARYRELMSQRPQWKRPKAKDVFRELQLPFLYDYCYDYASSQVHPMANDGEEDFLVLTHVKPEGLEMDRRVILNNSVLIHTMILQEGLNVSGMRWRVLVFDFISNARLGLAGDKTYRETMVKLVAAGPGVRWCERL